MAQNSQQSDHGSGAPLSAGTSSSYTGNGDTAAPPPPNMQQSDGGRGTMSSHSGASGHVKPGAKGEGAGNGRSPGATGSGGGGAGGQGSAGSSGY